MHKTLVSQTKTLKNQIWPRTSTKVVAVMLALTTHSLFKFMRTVNRHCDETKLRNYRDDASSAEFWRDLTFGGAGRAVLGRERARLPLLNIGKSQGGDQEVRHKTNGYGANQKVGCRSRGQGTDQEVRVQITRSGKNQIKSQGTDLKVRHKSNGRMVQIKRSRYRSRGQGADQKVRV